jgi:hypothetical protein
MSEDAPTLPCGHLPEEGRKVCRACERNRLQKYNVGKYEQPEDWRSLALRKWPPPILDFKRKGGDFDEQR